MGKWGTKRIWAKNRKKSGKMFQSVKILTIYHLLWEKVLFKWAQGHIPLGNDQGNDSWISVQENDNIKLTNGQTLRGFNRSTSEWLWTATAVIEQSWNRPQLSEERRTNEFRMTLNLCSTPTQCNCKIHVLWITSARGEYKHDSTLY